MNRQPERGRVADRPRLLPVDERTVLVLIRRIGYTASEASENAGAAANPVRAQAPASNRAATVATEEAGYMTEVGDEPYERIEACTLNRSDPQDVRQVEGLLDQNAAAREEEVLPATDRPTRWRRFAALIAAGLCLAAVVALVFVLQRPPVVGRATDAGTVALREEGWRPVRAGEELEAAEGLLRIRLLDGENFNFNQGSIVRVRSDGVDLLRGRVWARSAERRITISIGGYVLRMGPKAEAELMLRQIGTAPRVRVRVSEEAVLVGPHAQERRLSAGEMLEIDVCDDAMPRLP